jgi:hypothetical protein
MARPIPHSPARRPAAPRRADHLAADQNGSTIMEFALIAPTMLLMLLGGMDFAYRSYVTSIVEGEVQRSGRDSTIQGGAERGGALDNRIRQQVGTALRNATVTTSREFYSTFLATKPERFVDSNNNGRRDAGECYDDINGNSQWDARPARSGQGGAKDVTIYRVTVTYPRLFPIGRMLGLSNTEQIVVQTALKNQPFSAQSVAPVVNRCT